MEPLRSLLFVPGNRQNMLDRARTAPADALVPDLEDSVPLAEKANAREMVKNALPTLSGAGQKLIPRVNALGTDFLWDDLKAVIGAPIDGISVGKVSSREDVLRLDAMMAALEKERGVPVGQTPVIAWLETTRGMVNAYEICSACPRLQGVAFGVEDYAADLEVEKTEEEWQFLYVRSWVAIAAKAAGILAFATVYSNFRDEEGLVNTAKKDRLLGFKGKFAIHPAQVEPINRLFAPTEVEIEKAKRIVAAFQEAEARGSAAISVDGQMVDVPVAKRARTILAMAEAIARRGAPKA